MADTYDTIIKLSVDGADKVQSAYDAVAKSVQNTSKAVGSLGSIAGHTDFVKRTEAGGAELIKSFRSAKESLVDFAATKLGIPTSLHEWIDKAWELNEAYEKMEQQVAGLVVVTSDLGGKGSEGIKQAKEVAEGLMDSFKDGAYKAAVPLQEIESTYARILPLMGGMGKSQADAAEFAGDTASAAKVMGTSADELVGKLQRIALSHKASHRDAQSNMLFQKAGIKATDDYRTGFEKLQKVVKSIGGSVSALTDGTGNWIQRFRTLTEDILVKSTKPIFDSIGHVIRDITEWIHDNSDAIIDFEAGVTVVWEKFTDITSAVFNVKLALDAVKGEIIATARVADILVDAFEILDIFFGQGPDKLKRMDLVLYDMKIKALEFVNVFVSGIDKVSARILGLFDRVAGIAKYAPGLVNTVFPGFEGLNQAAHNLLTKESAQGSYESLIRDAYKEKGAAEAALNLEGPAVPSASARARMSIEEAIKLAEKTIIGGKSPTISIHEVNIHQNFKDQDPDAVMVEFTKGFERLSEAAIQSAVGGSASQFGPR